MSRSRSPAVPWIPCGIRLHRNYGKSPFLMGKSTISMTIFNGKQSVITRGYLLMADGFFLRVKSFPYSMVNPGTSPKKKTKHYLLSMVTQCQRTWLAVKSMKIPYHWMEVSTARKNHRNFNGPCSSMPCVMTPEGQFSMKQHESIQDSGCIYQYSSYRFLLSSSEFSPSRPWEINKSLLK